MLKKENKKNLDFLKRVINETGNKVAKVELKSKPMLLADFLTSYFFVVDMSYQRPFSANKEFVDSILNSIASIPMKDKRNKNDKYQIDFDTVGGRVLSGKNKEKTEIENATESVIAKIFENADGQHRVNTVSLMALSIAFWAKFLKYDNIAAAAMVLFSGGKTASFDKTAVSCINIYYKEYEEPIGYNDMFQNAVEDYMNAFTVREVVTSFSNESEDNQFKKQLHFIHSAVKEVIDKIGIEALFTIFSSRIVFNVTELPKWKSPSEYFAEKNSVTNIQNEEDLCKISLMVNVAKSKKKKAVSLYSKILKIAYEIEKKDQGKLLRNIYKAAYMSLTFTSKKNVFVVSTTTTAKAFRLSTVVEAALMKKEISTVEFFEKVLSFLNIYKSIKQDTSKYSIYLPMKHFLENIGDTKYRFFPFVFEMYEKIQKGEFEEKYMDIVDLVILFEGYLIQKSIVKGGNTEKTADSRFAELSFEIKNISSIKELQDRFVMVNKDTLADKEDFLKFTRLYKGVSSKFRKITAHFNDICFIKSTGGDLEDFAMCNVKILDSNADHVIPEKLGKVKNYLSLENINIEEIEKIEELLKKYVGSPANFSNLPEKYNIQKSNYLPCEFRNDILNKKDSVVSAYRFMHIPTASEFKSHNTLEESLQKRIEEFLNYAIPCMVFKS